MKKFLCMALAIVMVLSMVACGDKEADGNSDFKLGVILLHDETSTYDLNFIEAVNRAKTELGLKDNQVIVKRNIEEGNACYEAASELVDEGCNVVFADSFGHEDYMIQAAKEFKDVQFCHATGTKAHTSELSNYHNAFASIYEGRYLAGVAAGMKLKEMMAANSTVKAHIGYVGAFPYAEVVSGYSSFFLGVKSIVPEVTMDVQFTGSWYDEIGEKNAAAALIDRGCVLISQHADSMGAPSVCEERNVPNISYNGSTIEACPNTFIVSSKIDWTPYIVYICQQAMAGKSIDTDWTGTLSTGSVKLSDINDKACAAGTAKALEDVQSKLLDGSLKVFDTNSFTVGGKKLTSYLADVDDYGDYQKETEAIENGYFAESSKRSAPYFDIQIDGINLLN